MLRIVKFNLLVIKNWLIHPDYMTIFRSIVASHSYLSFSYDVETVILWCKMSTWPEKWTWSNCVLLKKTSYRKHVWKHIKKTLVKKALILLPVLKKHFNLSSCFEILWSAVFCWISRWPCPHVHFSWTWPTVLGSSFCVIINFLMK